MRSYTLEVDGVPKAQVRHRHKRFGGVYDPSAKDKMLFKARLVDQWDNEPLTGSISIKLRFKMPYRKSDFRTGKFAGELKPNAPTVHTVKPDIDNLEKFVLDALNGFVWKDDSQIWYVEKRKTYNLKPGIIIEVNET